MRGYPVYRIDPSGGGVLRVGTVLELRRSRRSMNRVGLARLAQKLFSTGPGDIIFVGSDTVIDRCLIPVEAASGQSAG